LSDSRREATLHNVIETLDLPRVPQQTRSRQKRDALLAAAARLFNERGYDATTADDIAAAAQVSVGTFYSYFRNKRQVFLTLFATCVESFLSLKISEIDFSSNPRQAVRQTVEQAMQRDPMFYGLRRACEELIPRDPEIAAFDRNVNQLIYQQILGAAQKLAAQGLIRPDIELEATCWLITLLLDRCWQTEPAPGEAPPEEIERQRRAIADLIYHALIKPS
jgi:AcrR family transcriptional regulator